MSEPTFKAPRKIQEIQAEYAQVLQRAGQCQYQISVFKKDLEMFNTSLRDLNAEAFAAKEAEEREKQQKAEEEKQSQERLADVTQGETK